MDKARGVCWLTDGGRSLLIQLPQPGDEVAVPATAKVAANASVTLVRDTEGVVQNGVGVPLPLGLPPPPHP